MGLTAFSQSDTLTFTFEKYQDTLGDTYTLVFDSTYYPEKNLHFIRILKCDSNTLQTLVPHQTYSMVIQRKLEQATGCKEDTLISFRSNRITTDVGTLFGSNYLEEQLAMDRPSKCEYVVVEYYYVKEVLAYP